MSDDDGREDETLHEAPDKRDLAGAEMSPLDQVVVTDVADICQ